MPPDRAAVALRYRVRPGVQWRRYADGVVVREPTSGEVHVLAPDLAALFEPGLVLTDSDESGYPDACLSVSRAWLLHLAALRIVEAA